MEKRVELLAPAGSYEAFTGALNAGADAVYLGGGRFGARAYAENFTAEEICRALTLAHFYGRKIYLTVNTLLKERELAALKAYLTSFYEAGLDGVIVQDLGVLRLIREQFPNLPLHISTQMTVTGSRGAAFLREQGAVRVVPARELTLPEVRRIKEESGMAVECFIHGAMCYCYSGQCLFSSILGGRSGNRGRCAQPCRLPYEIYEGKRRLAEEGYPLSLKDMCTLAYLPALIKAGVDSFKIEGRMKRPEYAAGVTAVYRKYIDLYYREGAAAYRVDPADLDRLRGLYIRSEIQTGYYERHNGKEMITLEQPGYLKSDETLLSRVRAQYVHEPEKMPVRLFAMVRVGEPLRLRIAFVRAGAEAGLLYDNGDEIGNLPGGSNGNAAGIAAEATGETVQAARNAPLTEADIRKQLCKMGDSPLSVTDCEVNLEGEAFVPVRALNALRRAAVERFIAAVSEVWRDVVPAGEANAALQRVEHGIVSENREMQENIEDRLGQSTENIRISQKMQQLSADRIAKNEVTDSGKRSAVPAKDCLVTTPEQFAAMQGQGCRRIYLESDLFLREFAPVQTTGFGQPPEMERLLRRAGEDGTDCYLALPYILRARDEAYLDRLSERMQEAGSLLRGVLVRNLESLAWVGESAGKKKEVPAFGHIVTDAGLYCFNSGAAAFLSTFCQEITLPYELNAGEASHLAKAAEAQGLSVNLIVYSHIPMMVTANCLQKTAGVCPPKGNKERIFLKDRYGMAFPVEINCEHCYNVLYNAVPYSLHGAKKEREKIGAGALRYDFVTESGAQCGQILAGSFPFRDYTTGHCKRGVE